MKKLLSFVLTAGIAAGLLAPAAAVPGGVVAIRSNTYTPGDDDRPVDTLFVARGTELLVRNTDFESHTLTHFTGGGTPLFDSGDVSTGQSRTVTGVESLAPGTYPFFCEHHPVEMRGTLHVL